MRKNKLSAACAAATLLVGLAGPVSARDVWTIPVIVNASNSAAQVAPLISASRGFADDLIRDDKGIVFNGCTAPQSPAGRYRVHCELSLGPVGDARISGISLAVRAGGAIRWLSAADFFRSDVFVPVTLDGVSAGGSIPVSVQWSFEGKDARLERLKQIRQPGVADEAALAAGGQEQDLAGINAILNGPTEYPDGTVNLKELAKLPCRLAVRGVYVEMLPPVMLRDIATDRIAYRPGETGSVVVTITNLGAKALTVTMNVDIRSGLADASNLFAGPVTVPGNQCLAWTGRVDTARLYWGAEATASLALPSGEKEELRSFFAVRTNFWETALAQFTPMGRANAESMRQAGTTVAEALFWAPDNFGDFTPDSEAFFGGEHTYPCTITTTKAFIDAAHARGIAVTVYADLWGGDGPNAFEMMRRHPDWFANCNAGSQTLEDWSLMEQGIIGPMNSWCYAPLSLDCGDAPLRVHAGELVASQRQFGWDGVRYDSYYSSPWVKQATRLVRELVQREIPGYGFGYNSIVDMDVANNALPVMVGGGQLVMEESSRGAAEGAPFAAYVTNLSRYRDQVWASGGHMAVCYAGPRHPMDNVYLSSLALAAGIHPYGLLEGQVGRHQAFGLRYSEFIYDNRLRPLKDPESVVAFGGATKFFEWQRLARTRAGEGSRQRLVLHLVNPPPNAATCQPNPRPPFAIEDQAVNIQLPAGATVAGVHALEAVPDARHYPLRWKLAGQALTVTVPRIRFWTVIVVDFAAPKGLPGL